MSDVLPSAPRTSSDKPGGAHAKAITLVRRDDDREDLRRPLSWTLMRRLWSYTRPYAPMRATLMVCVMLRGFQVPLMAWMIAAIINGPITDKNWSGLRWGAAGFAAFALFTYLTLHFRQRLALQLGERVVRDLRQEIFAHLQRMDMAFYDRTKVGRIISRMSSDAEAIRRGIQDVLFVTLVNIGHIGVAAAIMLWYDPPLFALVLAMSPLIWMLNRYFGRRIGVAWRQVQESMSRVTATLAESVSGIRVTQGFVRQEVNAGLFHDLVRDHADYNVRAQKLAGVYIPLLELNSQFFLSILIVLGGYQVLHQGFFAGIAGVSPEMTFAAVVVFVFQLPQFFTSIRTIAQQHNVALTAMAGAERVFALLDREPTQLEDADAIAPPRIEGRVVFEDVTFGYHPDRPVLHGIDFIAEPGQTIALVGHTGSGKSTIIKLISKFYLPTAGQLTIDGVDVRKLETDALIKQLGIVLQSNFLFTGTVLDNIRVGKPEATDEQVFDAARRLDCLDLLETLPNGLYTQVGEKGGSLSLGQRQLVCFCRAMLADPAILILDEATSSVDTMTEARIQKALEVLLAGRTSFVVAHRLSTIRHASQVLVLDHGHIVERGTHAELLKQGAVYANLYRQFIHATDA
ncbi:MAG: ABC transporter ATP-binding protein [Planctomycetota bacterium]